MFPSPALRKMQIKTTRDLPHSLKDGCNKVTGNSQEQKACGEVRTLLLMVTRSNCAATGAMFVPQVLNPQGLELSRNKTIPLLSSAKSSCLHVPG